MQYFKIAIFKHNGIPSIMNDCSIDSDVHTQTHETQTHACTLTRTLTCTQEYFTSLTDTVKYAWLHVEKRMTSAIAHRHAYTHTT